MPLSTILLALFIFLQAAAYLNWFYISGAVIGIIGIAFTVVVVIEAISARSVTFPTFRR